MSNLYRLIYTSFRRQECDDHEIQKILDACKKNNPGRNVTGVLLHSDSRFIQYMEGARGDVKELYEHIKTDPRHTAVNQRNFEPIEERVFPSWEMGYKDLSSGEVSFDSDITEKDKEAFNDLLSGETDFSNQGMRLLQLFSKT